jgi:hypothetical protein
MWYLWKARNDHRFRRKTWNPWQVHHTVAAHIAAYHRVHEERINNTPMQAAAALQVTCTHSQQVDRYTIQVPALLPGVRCYVDASTAPDQPSLPPRKASLGILFVNTQVQPAQTIYIKAQVTGIHSVLMAEAAALALAARVNDSFNFYNTIFLSDSQQLVHFLNQQDQTHPPDWRIKFFTQSFTNYSLHRRGKVLKINRNLNTTADGLARLALSVSSNTYEHARSYLNHSHHCPLVEAMAIVNLQHVTLLSASCC